jgi:hypothetical protein
VPGARARAAGATDTTARRSRPLFRFISAFSSRAWRRGTKARRDERARCSPCASSFQGARAELAALRAVVKAATLPAVPAACR